MNSISKILGKHFPTYGIKNIFWFYVVTIFGNTWFAMANWLLFILLFIDVRDFTIYESIGFVVAILIEIPSGAIADIFGKRRVIIAGFGLSALGFLLILMAQSGAEFIFIGNLITLVSFALKSGAVEAMVYDSLADNRKEHHYDVVIGRAQSLKLFTTVLTLVLGGIAWKYNNYAPLQLSTAGFIIATIFCFRFTEPKTDTIKFSWQNLIEQNKKGFYFLFKSDFKKYTFALVAMTSTYFMWAHGIIRIIMGSEFGYTGETLSYSVAVVSVVSLLAAFYFAKIRKRLGTTAGYGSLLAFSALAWLLSGLVTNSLFIGALVFIVLSATGTLADLWTSVIINQHVKSKERATAISTLSFLMQLPYLAIVVVFGSLSTNGVSFYLYFATSAVLFIGLIIFRQAEKKKIIVV
jgi:hypothetical protein